MNKSSMLLKLEADTNLFGLGGNPYPGRGIIAGLDETGENLVQVYWIMGRSENSRNRFFGYEGGRLFTEAADPSRMKDPSLVIYNAMGEQSTGIAVVSNGHQTDAVMGVNSGNVLQILSQWQYEPDTPNFTPRITATSTWLDERPFVGMSILRKSLFSDVCDRFLYRFNDVGRGFGYCFHTYSGDGDPLPAFRGEPYLLPLRGNIRLIAENFWDTLNPDNRVALAVKFIPKNGLSAITIINKYSKS